MDEQGVDVQQYLTNKYGNAAIRFNDPNSHLKVMGRKVGIEFTNDRKVVNSRRAHALVELLKCKGENNDAANAFMAELFESYFVRGENINDEKWLTDKLCGVDGGATTSKYSNVVDRQEAQFAMAEHNLIAIEKLDRSIKNKYNVSGVPFFMIYPLSKVGNSNNEKEQEPSPAVTFSGAYPPEVIAEQLQKVASSSTASSG